MSVGQYLNISKLLPLHLVDFQCKVFYEKVNLKFEEVSGRTGKDLLYSITSVTK